MVCGVQGLVFDVRNGGVVVGVVVSIIMIGGLGDMQMVLCLRF